MYIPITASNELITREVIVGYLNDMEQTDKIEVIVTFTFERVRDPRITSISLLPNGKVEGILV